MKKHNFSAGPSILPASVMKKASEAILDFNGMGLSLIEISHRSKEFIAVMERAQDLALELTSLKGKGYKALFLHGGASMQFLMVAYNLLEKKAGYINTGAWSNKAVKEAKLFGEVVEIASSKYQNFNFIPKGHEIPSELDYLHITTNNTIFGTQFQEIPETNVPLIADMSSDIFSRQFDYSKFDLFYAGAQMDYQVQLKSDSMFNTPAVFPIYTSMLTLEWLHENGGLAHIEKHNQAKAALIYNEIDRNPAFEGFAAKEDRSFMNATFNLAEGIDGVAFDTLWDEAGISGLKGHRSVGGYRASIYNALPLESTQLLVDVMQKFEQTL